MDIFFSNYLDELDAVHAEIFEALDGLPPEAIDWSPGQGVNSIAVLVAHIAGAERYWIGDVAMQDRKERDRDAEFRTRGLTAVDLRRRLEEVSSYAHSALEHLTITDLNQPRPVWRSEGEVTSVGGALTHALRHAGLHAGQIQITRDWWKAHSA